MLKLFSCDTFMKYELHRHMGTVKMPFDLKRPLSNNLDTYKCFLCLHLQIGVSPLWFQEAVGHIVSSPVDLAPVEARTSYTIHT